MMEWKRKDLITIEELTPNEINLILDTAEPFKEILRRNIKKCRLSEEERY